MAIRYGHGVGSARACAWLVAACVAVGACRTASADPKDSQQEREKADWKARVDAARAYGEHRTKGRGPVTVQSAIGVEVLPAKTPVTPVDNTARPEVTTIVASTPPGELARLRERARNAVGIVMYSASWCGVCSVARDYMREKGIAFVERDVEKRGDWKRRSLALNPRGSVPTFDVDGLVMVGFGSEHLDQLIARASETRLKRLMQGPKTILVSQP